MARRPNCLCNSCAGKIIMCTWAIHSLINSNAVLSSPEPGGPGRIGKIQFGSEKTSFLMSMQLLFWSALLLLAMLFLNVLAALIDLPFKISKLRLSARLEAIIGFCSLDGEKAQ